MTHVLENLTSIFNNRELAILTWSLPLLIIFICIKDIRKSLVQVLKAAATPYILIFCLSILSYSTAEVYILEKVGFWNFKDIKDTIIWLLFSGVIISFNSLTKLNEEGIFAKIVKDTFKFIIIFEFLVNLYAFSFWIELTLIPFITFVVLMKEVAKLNSDHKIVERVFSWVEVIVGLFLLIYSIIQAILNIETVFAIETVRQIFLTPILTLLLVPFIYFWLVYAIYENIFIRLKMGPEKDRSLIRYAKLKVLSKMRLRLSDLRGFSQGNAVKLINIKAKEDVDNLVRLGH